jgi:hypothetical protein
MKKTLLRLELEFAASLALLGAAGVEDKPRLYIRHLAASAELLWARADDAENRNHRLASFYRQDANAFDTAVEAARNMKAYMEEAHANS